MQKQTAKRLDQQWALKGQSLKTRTTKIGILRQFGLHLVKPFENATRENVQSYLAEVQKRCSPNTVENHKRVLKSAYKDLLNPDEPGHPSVVRWIRLANPFKETKTAEDLLTPGEVLRMAEHATHPRDRALILLMDESAGRLTEIAALRIADVRFDRYGALVTLGGDTDKRRVRLIHSVPDLARWLNEHPFRRQPERPLWVSWGSANRLQALGVSGILVVISRAAKAAGVSKHVHPHLLRHTRVNQWLDKYNDDVVKYFAGWSKSSQMVEVYRHRSGKRFDRVVLEREGLLGKEESRQDQELQARVCPRCREKNSPASEYCAKCSSALDPETVRLLAEEHDKLMASYPKLIKMLEDPRIKELLASSVAGPD